RAAGARELPARADARRPGSPRARGPPAGLHAHEHRRDARDARGDVPRGRRAAGRAGQPADGRADPRRPRRQNATEEEMEDDESEWQIRVADPHAPQPAWAKRKQEAEGSDQGGNKRQRTSGSPPLQSEAASEEPAQQADPPALAPQPQEAQQVARSSSPCVDPSLSLTDIAREFRFTLEEVEEYYAKCNNIARTKARFKKMREVLAALKDEDFDSD
ncbi:hypothetical protein EVJ58_g8262, partial [Rhodofomes roseus]